MRRSRSLGVGARADPRDTRRLSHAATAGATGHPPPGSSAAPQLQALEHFDFKGRVALSAAGNGVNANLRWSQNGTRSQLALEGPLGVGGTHITAERR